METCVIRGVCGTTLLQIHCTFFFFEMAKKLIFEFKQFNCLKNSRVCSYFVCRTSFKSGPYHYYSAAPHSAPYLPLSRNKYCLTCNHVLSIIYLSIQLYLYRLVFIFFFLQYTYLMLCLNISTCYTDTAVAVVVSV